MGLGKIRSKLITFPTLKIFEEQGTLGSTTVSEGFIGNVPYNSIVFIEDEGIIWSHGKLYSGTKHYLESLGNGLIMNVNGTPSAVQNYKLWGQIMPTDTLAVNGEITIVEGEYPAYDEYGDPIKGTNGLTTYIQQYANINLMIGDREKNDKWHNKIGWHIKGPYKTSSETNYNLSLSYTNSAGTDTNQLILGASSSGPSGATLSYGGFTINGSSNYTSDGKSISYAIRAYNNIITEGYLKGSQLYDTHVFIENATDQNWNGIQVYKGDIKITTINQNTSLITSTARHSTKDWQPWLVGVNSDYSSWGLGIANDGFVIGSISRDETTNKLTQKWLFKNDGKIQASGFKTPDGTNQQVLLADGTVTSLETLAGYELPIASINTLGGIQATTTTNTSIPSGKNYAVQVTTTGTAYVNVPWSNTNNSYATALVVGENTDSNKIGLTIGGSTSSLITVPYATSAGEVNWSNVSNKPGIVSTTLDGFAPANKTDNQANSSSSNGTYRFLGYDKNSSLKWYTLPATAFSNDNTTYTLKVGVSASDQNVQTILSGTTTTSGTILTNTAYSSSNKIATMADISTALTSYLVWKDNTEELPINAATKVGFAWRASKAITIPADNSITGNIEIAEIGDILICTTAKTTNVNPKFTVAQTNWSITDGTDITLEWGKTKTLATVGGVTIDVTAPANPNTDNTILKNGSTILTSSSGLILTGGTNKFTVSDGTKSFDIAVSHGLTFYNLAFQNSSGTQVDIYKPTTSPNKILKASTNVQLSAKDNIISISATDTTYKFNALKYKNGNTTGDFYTPAVASNATPVNRTIVAGTGISLTVNNNELTITNSSPDAGLTTKNLNVNGTNYAIYTSASSLPTIYASSTAPTSPTAASTYEDTFLKVRTSTDANKKVSYTYSWVKASDIVTAAEIQEATTENIGGIKLTSKKATSYVPMASSTTGIGYYPVYMNSNSTLYVQIEQANTWIALKGATSSTDGIAGYVPQPKIADREKFLRGDGTWTQLGSNAFESHTIYDVTTAVNGVSITLKNDGWVDACTINDKDTGTYAIQITETNSISSGIFSILKSGTDTEIDEIWLHTVNKASTSYHIFARVSGTKLQVACTAAGAKTLTIKIKRLI